MNYLLVAIVSLLTGIAATVIGSYFLLRRSTASAISDKEQAQARCRELEKSTAELLMERSRVHADEIDRLAKDRRSLVEDCTAKLTELSRAHADELERLNTERRALQEAHFEEMSVKVRQAQEAAYEEAKRQLQMRGDQSSGAISIFVRPYIRKTKNDGLLSRRAKLEIGYQYQLQINGIPCFAPHIIIEKYIEEKEVNQEAINAALEAAKAVIAMYAGTAAALIPCPIIIEQ